MCGIAGAYQQVDGHDSVETMSRVIAHRGPDDCGLFSFADERVDVHLAHRRLSIIDLSGGHQPLSKEGLTLSYNGELYNYREIRADLAAHGARFDTSSDTEVVLEAWRAWGPDCLTRFRGMFAFALFDATTGSLFLARDQLGIKPLFYLRRKDGVVFSSEMKAIVAAFGRELRMEPSGLVASMLFWWVPDKASCIQNVSKLEPGTWAEFRPDATCHVRTYWSAPMVAAEASTTAPTDLADVIESSVAAHLVADVPVATFLSGGLDSSLISVLARRQIPDLEAYTITFRPKDQRLEAMPDDAKFAADRGGHVRHQIARDRDRSRRGRHAPPVGGDPRRTHRRPRRDQHPSHVRDGAGRRCEGSAVGNGRRRALRRVPQAPGVSHRSPVPPGSRRHPTNGELDGLPHAGRGGRTRVPLRPMGKALPHVLRSSPKRPPSVAATRSTTLPSSRLSPLRTWRPASIRSSTSTSRSTPTPR